MRSASSSFSTSVGSIGASLVSAVGMTLASFAAIGTDVLFGGQFSDDFAIAEFVVEFSGGVGAATDLLMDWACCDGDFLMRGVGSDSVSSSWDAGRFLVCEEAAEFNVAGGFVSSIIFVVRLSSSG